MGIGCRSEVWVEGIRQGTVNSLSLALKQVLSSLAVAGSSPLGAEMGHFLSSLLGSRLMVVLVISYLLVAGLMGVLTTLATEGVIDNYLSADEEERVARDMKLADAFYRLRRNGIAGVAYRMAQDSRVLGNLEAASRGDPEAIRIIDEQIVRKLTVPALNGTQLLAVLDTEGRILTGRTTLATEDGLLPVVREGNWGELPIIKDALLLGREQEATEIIPVNLLAQVGLDRQAYAELIDTPWQAPRPFDAREGTAGLALTGVYPLRDADSQVNGAILALHLLNNDVDLVDDIKNVAGIDTATIFLGDLRIATNVLNQNGQRAVGTRMAQNVYQVTLEQKRDFVGRAYVVTDWFITYYKPLRDHGGQVVGVLYVGARESSFLRLVNSFHRQAVRIALLCLALTSIIALPVAHVITWPVTDLVHANQRLAEGDRTVRVQSGRGGELAMLGRSFNNMVETLHRTEQELLHKERLAAMGQLAAGVAHEINNPLGTILLFADSLYKDLPEQDPRRKDLQMILQETSRCKDIVANLLNFARQQKVLAQETDVHTLMDQVIERLRRQPVFQQVEVVRRFEAGLPQIQADPAQIQQVFTNLFSNAAEAMKGNGTLTVTTRRVNQTWVEIVVADTGRGIPEENLSKLFTPFFTTKPQGKGTGLGLAIVYGIIKMHRGQVTVQSQTGKGTSFTVTLPIGLKNGDPGSHSRRVGAID